MNAVLQFLSSLRSLYKAGVIKSVDQAMDFAKQQFGQIDDLFKRQIEEVFKAKPKKEIPPGGGGITSIKNAPKKQEPGIMDQIEASGQRLEGAANRMAEIQKEIDAMYKPKPETSPLMTRLEEGIETLKSMKQPGMDLVTGLTRTAARKILDRAGIKVPDKADPIDIFAKEFGGDVLVDVKNVAEEMIELEQMGKSTKSMDEILEQTGLFNVKRNPDAPQGISDEQLEQIKKEVDQEKQLEDFDTTDRPKNAMGGFQRTGFADGPPKPKGKGIMNVIKKIPKVGKIAGGLETAIGAIQKKFGKDIIKTADELPAKELTDAQKFEARELVTNTINDVKKLEPMDAMKEVNKVIAREGKYKNLSDEQVQKIFDDTNDHIFERDVVPKEDDIDITQGLIDLDEFNVTKNASAAKKELDEMAKKRSFKGVEIKDPTFDENLPFDNDAEKLAEIKMSNEAYEQQKILDDVDRAYGVTPKMKKELDEMAKLTPKAAERFDLKMKYPGIDENLLTSIVEETDPQKKAEVIATIEQAFELMRRGKSPDEILAIFKKATDRTKQATGGLSYLMGM